MKRISLGLLILGVLPLLVTAVAKDKLKPWTQWTAADAEKILSDSPWAQSTTFSFSSVALVPGLDGYSQSGHMVYFRIRLISALPIRQAVLRTLELSPSKPAPEQIENARRFLDRKFNQTIVVAIAPDTTHFGGAAGAASPIFGPLFQAFNGAITSTLRKDTFLELDNGKRVFLQEYQPPTLDGLGAMFIFPRVVDDAPFITSNARSVRFFSRFPTPSSLEVTSSPSGYGLPTDVRAQPMIFNIRFKVADFQYNGVLEY
jgi:hypothetical protein